MEKAPALGIRPGTVARLSPVFKIPSADHVLPRAYAENLALMSIVLRNKALLGGAIVECGTWRGGMAAGMVEVGGPDRVYHFFDSFEGLPPAGPLDGERARAPIPFDNCRASLEEFQTTIFRTRCAAESIRIHAGYFDKTLPVFVCPPLAILRLDCDWYESTMICLETFWNYVLPGGLILLDDYFAWEGCSKTVHAFLAKRNAADRLAHGPLGRVTYILKQPNPSS
jgi:O-methyltransferase